MHFEKFSALPDQLKMCPNGALVRTMRPSPSSVGDGKGRVVEKARAT